MAELKDQPAAWTAAYTRGQLGAVAWLRWRIFVNAFRRRAKKRSAGSLLAIILLRFVVWTILVVFLAVPVLGCGVAAYYGPGRVAALLWAIFGIQFFLGLNTAATAKLGFDLTPLLRFPVAFRTYLGMRLFFGLFTIPTVLANLALLSCAIGLGIARRGLLGWALLVLGVFSLTNLFLVRMVLSWIERWMSTRRAREIFGGIFLVVSLGAQAYFYSLGNAHGAASRWPVLAWLGRTLGPVGRYAPPDLAARSLTACAHDHMEAAAADLLALAAFGVVFLSVFALRLRAEYRGENLSEAGPRAPRQTARAAARPEPELTPLSDAAETHAVPPEAIAGEGFHLPQTVAACVQKELIELRRSGSQFYGLITPIFFIFIFSRRNGLFAHTPFLLPYAVGYTMLGLLARLYNVLGSDGPGYNLYFLAPVRLRDVFVGKNLVGSGLIAAEVLLASVCVFLISAEGIRLAVAEATFAWVVFAVFANLAVGNLRSVLSPIRFEAGKAIRPKASGGTGVITLGVMLGSLALCVVTLLLCRHFGVLWVAAPIFAGLAAAAMIAYVQVLGRIDALASARREELSEALTKTAV